MTILKSLPLPTRRVLTYAEAADYLGVKTSTIRRLCTQGVLPCVRISQRCVRIKISDLDAWIEAKSQES